MDDRTLGGSHQPSERLHNIEDGRVLIVDDESPNVMLLEKILKRAGFSNLANTTDAREAVSMFISFKPDIVLLDLHMPHIEGFEIMEELHGLLDPQTYLPVLVLTADVTQEAKKKALSSEATDFLTKPLDAAEVVLRVRNLLQTRCLHLELHHHNKELENRVQQRTSELELAQLEILERLAHASEYRDDETGQHTKRVARTAALVAQSMGMPPDEVELIRRAAPLHDVGKIGVPDGILLKPGKLTAAEFDRIKTHTSIGAGILSGSRFSTLQIAEEIALIHHERWDGTGYEGLSGDAIPISGRIVAVADVFDALTHERPYKKAWPVDEAVAEIESQANRQFDPAVVAAFLVVRDQENIMELDDERLGQMLTAAQEEQSVRA